MSHALSARLGLWVWLLLAAGLCGSPAGATPLTLMTTSNPCRVAAAASERAWNIPAHLLAAISRVETGRPDAQGDRVPWPWSVNAEGVGSTYASKEEAVAAVRRMQGQGMKSIDVGCMQVNLMHHPDAFASLEEAFDPFHNADYAARFLTTLHDQTGSWPAAAAAYHSMTPELGRNYLRQVLEAWPQEALGGGLETLGRAAPRTPQTPLRPDDVGARATPGAIMLSNGSEHARTLPAPASAPPGRSLDAYRTMPILLANRPGRARS